MFEVLKINFIYPFDVTNAYRRGFYSHKAPDTIFKILCTLGCTASFLKSGHIDRVWERTRRTTPYGRRIFGNNAMDSGLNHNIS